MNDSSFYRMARLLSSNITWNNEKNSSDCTSFGTAKDAEFSSVHENEVAPTRPLLHGFSQSLGIAISAEFIGEVFYSSNQFSRKNAEYAKIGFHLLTAALHDNLLVASSNWLSYNAFRCIGWSERTAAWAGKTVGILSHIASGAISTPMELMVTIGTMMTISACISSCRALREEEEEAQEVLNPAP